MIIMESLPMQKNETALSLLRKAVHGVADIVLFVVVLCFTGITIVALAIAAPLAVAISALIGSRREGRSGWKAAKAS